MENVLLPITFKFSSEVLIHLYNYFNAGNTHRIETSTRNVHTRIIIWTGIKTIEKPNKLWSLDKNV